MDFPSFNDLFRVAESEVLSRNSRLTQPVIERQGTDSNALVAGSAAVGWYGAASRIVENYGMIPGILVSSLFPTLSRQFRDGHGGLAATSSEAMALGRI